jgi:hypothetical protein
LKKDGGIYISDSEQFAFKLKHESEVSCDGIRFHSTTEGMFVAVPDNNEMALQIQQLPISKRDFLHIQDNDIRSLMLSNADYVQLQILKVLYDIQCSSFINLIRGQMDSDSYMKWV